MFVQVGVEADRLFSVCRCKPKLKLRIINQNSVSVLQTPPDPEPPTEQEHSRGQRSHKHSFVFLHLWGPSLSPWRVTVKSVNLFCLFSPGDLECEIKSDSSPERDHAPDDDVTKEASATDGNKKRKRKPYRPGEFPCRLHLCLLLSSLPVTFISPCFSVCPRYWWIHGASAWSEGRSRQNQTMQKRFNRDAAGSRRRWDIAHLYLRTHPHLPYQFQLMSVLCISSQN